MVDLKVIAALFVLVVGVAAVNALQHFCPYSNINPDASGYLEMGIKSNINSGSYKVHPVVGDSVREHSLDAVIKSYVPKYMNDLDSWVNIKPSESETIICGIPPSNCLNDTQNLYYRSVDGACNNFLNPGFGMAISRYERLMQPRYGDLVYSPGRSVSGAPLPNVRLLSLSLYGEQTHVDEYRTMAAMQWGHFVGHDISQLTTKGAPTDCCTNHSHKQCYPINLTNGGPIAYNTGKSCISFARSISDADAVCPKSYVPYHEKLSMVTAYLDLSSIYGNSVAQSQQVRLFSGGLLRTSFVNNQHWLPVVRNANRECGSENECYSVPDQRNRFIPTIAVLHTVLVREHNRLAEQLAFLNPHYSDENLFQEARKINIAQYQKITYYDWLPLFVGKSFAQLEGLIHPQNSMEYVNDYDESINAGAFAEFSSAAFRYSHTQIPGWFSLVAPDRSTNQTLRLSDYFERPSIIRLLAFSDNFDALLRGLATQLQKRSDANVDPEIKHFFNRKELEEYGSDLKSLDIQRGRDFGLPSYNDMREFCGLHRAIDWSQFANEIPSNKISTLRTLYASPDDVEVAVGGSMERHVSEALFGPTFQCIIAKQFLNTRRGDRFFFEHEHHQSGFSRSQLLEIRKVTLASLFCNNANYLQFIQSDVFVFPNERNVLLNCNDIAKLDIRHWQDKRPNVMH